MVKVITVGSFRENCYLLVRDGEVAVIDPGDEGERIAEAIDATGATPKYVLITHAHIDHVGAAQFIKDRYHIPLWLPPEEAPLLEQLRLQCALFGLEPIDPPVVDHFVTPDFLLPLGSAKIEARLTPGHSPGGTSYLSGDEMFVGDTIFAGSVGRTDLWGGSWPVLQHAIESQIFSLHDEVVLYPGHGPSTTVGNERRQNPFFVS
ncbi:MAG: MBL fold metallo-hydrolase [Candidatus Sericytochromatia bacterium]|nr:MBL fold metallo-hydrolase [Candidatus Sericytochromatia bacterium]